MNALKKFLGQILYYITQGLSVILDLIIGIVEFSVILVNSIKGIFTLLGAGGCLLFFMFAGPFGLFLLFNPGTMLLILFFIVFPILGTTFISFLKYIKYMVTEFLFDRANYLMHGTRSKYDSFFEYGNKYKREEEAKQRAERQRRQQQQQKEWEERFRQWQEYQNSQRNNTGGYNTGTYHNPSTEFINKFEKSCHLLSVDPNADKYQIKLAYRKQAKKYHPDINKAPDATQKFQEINDAYDFLSDENIERYKRLKSN